ncbi:hypothetical protein FHY55_17580 [Oceanicola sp. D3]|uniref:hypothetical protein n=1 Tax=Oceanicola sp. D3 TaxID=2587163 RepID=UPI0011212FA3|nr:hypothetical protein [Oceanicola sp. D3]QDC10936.1 hypothetical protein FHY55_17580 [Oceanicola sp. D3]
MTLSRHLNKLLMYFNANVSISDRLPRFVESLSELDRQALQQEFKTALEKDLLTERDFYKATSCSPASKDSARAFFESVYRYAFEGGEETDLSDYWLKIGYRKNWE